MARGKYRVEAKIFKWTGKPEETSDTSIFQRNLSSNKVSEAARELQSNSTRGAAWFFVRIEKETAENIRDNFGMYSRGWGSLPVNVTIGNSTWKTSIFPDKQTYLLPIKSQIRKTENIQEGDELNLKLEIIAETSQIPAPALN
jgi:hypothetical protein